MMLLQRAGAVRLLLVLSLLGAGATEETDQSKSLRQRKLKTGETVPAAQDLGFFRREIDPDIFEWVDRNEIKAGEATCGFLKPPLGSVPGWAYPKIQVYACVLFATQQPAALGNVFVHCGGPGSMSDCVFEGGATFIGPENLASYNLIAIDQRGLGRSWPSFAHPECTLGSSVVDGKTVYEGMTITSADISNEVMLRDQFRKFKDRYIRCWTCEDCDFQLEATDGSGHSFHFLQYSGTKQLAEDMDRIREAFGAEKLSVYGLSYGTQVMATYATMFPDRVDKFVVDSNMPANQELVEFASDIGINWDRRMGYLIGSCNYASFEHPDGPGCPVADMRSCIDNSLDLIRNHSTKYSIIQAADFMAAERDQAPKLCDAASEKDYTTFNSILDEYFNPPSDGADDRKLQDDKPPSPSQPSSTATAIYDNPEYQDIMVLADDVSSIPTALIIAQDYTMPFYDEDWYVQRVIQFNQEYDGMGTGVPAWRFMGALGVGYFWPNPIPLPPRGNPSVSGIVAGVVHDFATPYKWTRLMQQAFPSAHFLTTQGIIHGVGANRLVWGILGNEPPYEDCVPLIYQYWATGEIVFDTGMVCRAFFPQDGFAEVFTPPLGLPGP